MSWEDAEALMNEAVDDVLGDTIMYGLPGALLPVKGFVILANDAIGAAGIDEVLTTSPRIKVSKAQVVLPVPGHRLTHPKLGTDTYRPMNKQPENAGLYWLIEVQKT